VPSDIVRMICPNLRCRALLSVPTAARGKTVRCRQCGTRVKVPQTLGPAHTETPDPAATTTSEPEV
jgi:RNase P subunit RPR2